MQEVRLRTSVETRDERQVLTLRDPTLFAYPFLYMTGERSFEPFSDEELEVLRRYLLFGGLLLIDDARGNKGRDFDASVRQEIARLFPDRALKILQPEHTVFRTFYLIRTIGGVPVLARTVAAFESCQDVAAIVLVLNPDNMAGAAEMSAEYRWTKVRSMVAGGERRQDSVRAGLAAVADMARHDSNNRAVYLNNSTRADKLLRI